MTNTARRWHVLTGRGSDLGAGAVEGARSVSVTITISPDLFGEHATVLLGFDVEQCAGECDAVPVGVDGDPDSGRVVEMPPGCVGHSAEEIVTWTGVPDAEIEVLGPDPAAIDLAQQHAECSMRRALTEVLAGY